MEDNDVAKDDGKAGSDQAINFRKSNGTQLKYRRARKKEKGQIIDSVILADKLQPILRRRGAQAASYA